MLVRGGPAGQQFRGTPAQSTVRPVGSSFWCRWCCGGPHPFGTFSVLLLCHYFSPKKKSVKKHMITSALKVKKDCLQPRASGRCMAKLGPPVREEGTQGRSAKPHRMATFRTDTVLSHIIQEVEGKRII